MNYIVYLFKDVFVNMNLGVINFKYIKDIFENLFFVLLDCLFFLFFGGGEGVLYFF